MNEHFGRLVGDYLIQREIKEERLTLAQRLIAFLGAACLIVLTFIAATYQNEARAEEIPLHVHEQDGLLIRLMPGPCVEPRSAMFLGMVPEYAGRAKALKSVWRMKDGTNKPFAGCWLELSKAETGGEDVLVLVFEDGERYVVPKAQFGKKAGPGA